MKAMCVCVCVCNASLIRFCRMPEFVKHLTRTFSIDGVLHYSILQNILMWNIVNKGFYTLTFLLFGCM